ncbi:hypothetical protein BJV82DRAFT_523364 [Fennellomyces sp. T-0311]|nr:hypothetical protein BJV82DRAFT_523364 [Fennellomyces sp. T-0311]
MALAVFALVVRRWSPSGFVMADYEAYRHLADYLPKELFEQRTAVLHALAKEKYPDIYPDTYMFMAAVSLVIVTAAFSIVARGLDISMWYPLLILIAPALLAFGTTRRRSMHYRRFLEFQDTLQTTLKDMTAHDLTRHLKWDYRRLRHGDTAEILHLQRPLSSWTISLVVEIIQIDPEIHLNREVGEALPSYGDATQDIVLDIGPAAHDTVLQLREMDLTDCRPPPDYHEAPPAYNPSESDPSARNSRLTSVP